MKKRPIVRIEVNESTTKTRPILEQCAQKYGRDIFLHATHHNPHQPIDDGNIHIFPFATACTDFTDVSISKIFGIKPHCNDAIAPNESEITETHGILMKDDNGFVFGEAHGENGLNNFFIHLDITHEWDEENEKIFSLMMNNYFSLITNQRKMAAIMKQLYAKKIRMKKESKEKYLEICSQKIQHEIELFNTLLQSSAENIKYLSMRLTEACRNHDLLKQKIEKLHSSEITYQEIEREYNNLINHGSITKVYVRDKDIVIFTKKLILKRRNIGNFKITIDTESKEFSCENIIQIINDEYHHPHISGGDLCFGNATAEIVKYIEQFQFYVAFCQIWARLNRYDADNAYYDIGNWPKA